MGAAKKSMKRYAYVPIAIYKGVDDEYLDQVLVRMIGERRVRTILENNATALKSLKITKTKLVKGQVDLKPRLMEIGSLLKENYALFNYCANFLNDIFLEKIKEEIEKHDPNEGALFDTFVKLIEDSHENYYLILLFCRHYKNGIHKDLINNVVDYWGHIDREDDDETEKNKNIELIEPHEEKIENDKLIQESNNLTKEQLRKVVEQLESFDSSPRYDRFEDVALLVGQMSKWMQTLNLRIKVASEKNISREVDYEENLLELKQLEGEIEAQSKELLDLQKQNKRQLASYSTENNKLKKLNIQIQEKLENQLREHGKSTQLIGEIRKEKSNIIAEMKIIELKLTKYEKEKITLEQTLRTEMKKEYDQIISLKLNEKALEYNALQQTLDEQINNNRDLEKEKTELLVTLSQMEKENCELLATLKELKQIKSQINVEKLTHVVEEQEDNIALDTLMDFVNFNNQPHNQQS
ncbi:hypothetical protein [Paenibacillus sp. NPDC057934]|uniref:hypothetical protein n=1 Tax=Paenibacillus sp. NPDC057934 TaxID=3346282 RepID=UPI0036DC0660